MTVIDEIGTVLNGVPLAPLPDGWKATGVAAVIQCLDENGEKTWSFRTSMHLSDEEVLGALVIRTAIAKRALLDAYTINPEDEDEDEDEDEQEGKE